MATASSQTSALLSQVFSDNTVVLDVSITVPVAIDNAVVRTLSSIRFGTAGSLVVVDTPRTTLVIGKASTLVLSSGGYLENSSQGTSTSGTGLTVPKGVIG